MWTGRPSSRISPSSPCKAPVMILISVDFPAASLVSRNFLPGPAWHKQALSQKGAPRPIEWRERSARLWPSIPAVGSVAGRRRRVEVGRNHDPLRQLLLVFQPVGDDRIDVLADRRAKLDRGVRVAGRQGFL